MKEIDPLRLGEPSAATPSQLETSYSTPTNIIHDNNIFEAIREFSDKINTMPKPWHKANRIDRLVTHALLFAEKKCTTPTKFPWSEEYERTNNH